MPRKGQREIKNKLIKYLQMSKTFWKILRKFSQTKKFSIGKKLVRHPDCGCRFHFFVCVRVRRTLVSLISWYRCCCCFWCIVDGGVHGWYFCCCFCYFFAVSYSLIANEIVIRYVVFSPWCDFFVVILQTLFINLWNTAVVFL